MFNKYFGFIKDLFDSVFRGGETVSFTDYLYVIGFTLALIVCFAAVVVALFFVCKGPTFVYKKIVKKVKAEIAEVDNAVATKNYDKYPKDEISEIYNKLNAKFTKRKIYFALGVIFLYIPFVIPTFLFIASLICSWF